MNAFDLAETLTLLDISALPVRPRFVDLGTEDACCAVWPAQPTTIAPPEIEYRGGRDLRPTDPNMLQDSNPGLLFPRVIPGHSLNVAVLRNAVCHDGGIIVCSSDRIFSESFRHISRPRSRTGLHLMPDGRFRLEEQSEGERRVSGKSLFLDGEHFAAYGHFLGEVLTRLWIHKFVDLSSFNIVCGKVAAPHLMPLLEPFGIHKEQIILNEGRVVCDELWVPSQSFLVRQSTTPAARSTWNVVGDFYDEKSGPEKVYVSRSRAGSRPLVNERSVEQLFRSRGFEIVFPELLPVPAQVSLFRNTKFLAGCSGSNMFNCAFSPSTQKKFFLTSRNYVLHTDVLMNIDSPHPITYVIGEPEREGQVHAPWRVDVDPLADALDRWLN